MTRMVMYSTKTFVAHLKIGDKFSLIIDDKEPRYEVTKIEGDIVYIKPVKELSYIKKEEIAELDREGICYVYTTKRYKGANYA